MTTIKREPPSLRGDRVKSVRILSGHTRKSFFEQFGIPIATLRSWEEPPTNRCGITKNGAIRMCEAVHSCGLLCSPEWLLYGEGPGPTMIRRFHHKRQRELFTWNQEESIIKDIKSFKRHNPEAIVITIANDAMTPFYSCGDYVAGIRRQGKDIKCLAGMNCIIEVGNKTLVRRIVEVNKDNLCTLSGTNLNANTPQLIISNIKIDAAAQIVWHRTREKRLLKSEPNNLVAPIQFG